GGRATSARPASAPGGRPEPKRPQRGRSRSMADTIAAPPGWYYVRVREGSLRLVRYPVAAWRVALGQPAEPRVAEPGEAGLAPPRAEDLAGLVGLVPPDREYQSYFSTEDIQEAARRLFGFLHAKEAAASRRSTVREVTLPGVGPIPVRDAAPG